MMADKSEGEGNPGIIGDHATPAAIPNRQYRELANNVTGHHQHESASNVAVVATAVAATEQHARAARVNNKERCSCAIDFSYTEDIASALSTAADDGFDFIALPIVHPRYHQEFTEGPAKHREGAFTFSDTLLTSTDWNNLIVGKTSPWINVDDPDLTIRTQSVKAFEREVDYMCHLGLPAIMTPLNSYDCANLASIMYNYIAQNRIQQFWVRVPALAPAMIVDDDVLPSKAKTSQVLDTWKWWNKMRTLVNSDRRVSVVLELTVDLPDEEVLKTWRGENIKCAIIPTEAFLTNKCGYPVLSKPHQNFVRHLYKLECQMMISGRNHIVGRGMEVYHQYMNHLFKTQPAMDEVEKYAQGFEDNLQIPLQPLSDNLESHTYEVFEKDPVKYSQYQKAIQAALLDKISDEEKDKKSVTLMVLGAGRGPLVKASIAAGNVTGRKLNIIAVDKNPNAVNTLFHMKNEVWGEQVEVVCTDMRNFKPKNKADIMVSELLGSFGDNELSPECLDGGQHVLKDDGISIPYKYTSFVCPLHSPKLYQEVANNQVKDVFAPKVPEAAFESPYVVRIHNRTELAPAQPLFTFHHPNWGVIDNSRYKKVNFKISSDAMLHGFAGYFECNLYKDIDISILPDTYSDGMFSWFPVFIPLKDPVHLHAGCSLEAHFWRKVNSRRVWYEWAVTEPYSIPIHNCNARSYEINLH